MLIARKRLKRILFCTVAGGVLGSFIGIAGFGSAISGTVPLAILGGWLAYLYTRKAKPTLE